MALSDAFGGSAKAGDNKTVDPFAMLSQPAAVLAPPAPRPATTAPAKTPAPAPAALVATPGPVDDEPAAPKAPAVPVQPTRTSATRRPKKPAESPAELDELAQATSQVQVYLAPWAIRTARDLAKAEGVTNAEIAYDAIDAAGDSLNDLIRDRRVDRRPPGSAFPGRSTRRRPRHGSGAGAARTLWSLQATVKEREVLERLVRHTGAESVSQMVSAAVEWHLADSPMR